MRGLTHSLAGCLLLAVAFCTAGCGTILQGTKQTIKLSSDPSGVEVSENGRLLANSTPAEVELARGSSHKLTFNKQGFRPVTVPLARHAMLKWWVIDAFTLGVGNLVDAVTGALFEIRPRTVHVIMDPAEDTQGR